MKKTMLTLAVLLFGTAFAMAEAINLTKTLSTGMPEGWEAYGHGGSCRYDNGALRITTSAPQWEWGIRKVLPIKGNGKYTFSLEVARPYNAVVNGNFSILIVAGSQQGTIGRFSSAQTGMFSKVSSTLTVFDTNVQNVTIYIFSSKQEVGDYLIRNAELTRSLK